MCINKRFGEAMSPSSVKKIINNVTENSKLSIIYRIAYYQRFKGKEPVFGSVNYKLIVLLCGVFP